MTVAISLSSVRHSFVASEGDAVQAVADFTLDIDEGRAQRLRQDDGAEHRGRP